jgi:hypothetical protein
VLVQFQSPPAFPFFRIGLHRLQGYPHAEADHSHPQGSQEDHLRAG